ncbi:MAG: M48 family metalloprotease [Isosphaeraceae bacterium]|nr:M48 family metalloprotease [Isosphaeraceae bacterium]
MARYGIAALVGCLYIAAAALVVRSQGDAYRATFRQTRIASLPPAPPPEPTAKKPEPAPAQPVRPQPTVIAANVPPVTPSASQPMPPPTPPAPAPERPAPQPKPKDAPTSELDPFWTSPHLKEVWDLSHVKTEDEIRLGQQLHELILQFNPAVQGPYLRRVKEAAAPLLEQRSRKDINYTFTVLDSEDVCAFSHPGGYVYVCRGLFDMIGEDEEYALKFVLAHEIAHVDLQHALKCLADPGFKDSGIGTLQAYYFFIAPMGYQESQEYEADAWALQKMRRLDHSRYETLSFLRKFKTYAEENGFEDGKKPPAAHAKGPAKKDQDTPARSAADVIENHFRAHPAAWERLKKLEALWPAGKS